MRLTFSTTVLALGAIKSNSDAFLSNKAKSRTAPTTGSITVPRMADDSNNDSGFIEEDKASEGSGSTRFQEMMKAAQEKGSAESPRHSRVIMNPFLNPASSTPPQTQPPINPENLSVEEQARMFREFMAGKQQQSIPSTNNAVPPSRVSRTDQAGRPIGRNRDADTIANTSDLYFAQLKRDSTVRTLGRIRGEKDVSEAVFEDEGIEQLNGLLQENPHLQGQKDKEIALYNSIPDELMKPYLGSDNSNKNAESQSGISYKQRLKERRGNKAHAGTSPVVSSTLEPSKQEKPVDEISSESELPVQDVVKRQIDVTSPPIPSAESPVVSEAEIATHSSPLDQLEEEKPPNSSKVTKETSVPTNPDDIRQKIRTLMGLMLKHRGGSGFGKGRLKGQEIDRFEGLLMEITNLLREEPEVALPLEKPAESNSVSEQLPAGSTSVGSIDNTNTDSTTDSRIESMIACIDGAVKMYQNCPVQLKESVLVTLRAALVSAVDTCNMVLGQSDIPLPQPPPSPPATPTTTGTFAAPNPSQVDPNSKKLEEIYEKVQAASGDGNLGLRSDLTSHDATALADQLVDMRNILMEELNSDTKPVETSEASDNAIGQESSASSRYQEMLAKARAEKARQSSSTFE